MIKTYLNREGVPIIRKCNNCINFISFDKQNKMGYCKVLPLFFAFTYEKSVYAIVKDFYVCEKHRLLEEDFFEFSKEPIDLVEYLKERNAKKQKS